MHILLVEDHCDTSSLMRRLLEREGFELTSVGTVADAHEACRQVAFDLLLCDIVLPDGNGWDLVTELRRTRAVPAIALTGRGFPADIEASRNAGFALHLVKPLPIEELVRAIRATIADGNGNGDGRAG